LRSRHGMSLRFIESSQKIRLFQHHHTPIITSYISRSDKSTLLYHRSSI
jgi:hypothetical protein